MSFAGAGPAAVRSRRRIARSNSKREIEKQD
jgi:hypothetical protein